VRSCHASPQAMRIRQTSKVLFALLLAGLAAAEQPSIENGDSIVNRLVTSLRVLIPGIPPAASFCNTTKKT